MQHDMLEKPGFKSIELECSHWIQMLFWRMFLTHHDASLISKVNAQVILVQTQPHQGSKSQ